jgi:predicted O-methyltransferase YrrM
MCWGGMNRLTMYIPYTGGVLSAVNVLLLIYHISLQQPHHDENAKNAPVMCHYNSFSAVDFQSRVKWLDQYLIKNNAPIIEGHSAQYESQWTMYSHLFSSCSVHSIAEIGFNAGHSTLIMLMSNQHLKIQSFDLGAYESSRQAWAVLKKHFPQRTLNMVWGDSTQTVPQFSSEHADTKFDIVIVDGGHTYEIAYADILNMKKLSHKDTVLIVDDTVCEAYYCVDKAFNDLRDQGVIEITEQIPLGDGRGMSLARYIWDQPICSQL